ncbi:MAG: anti-sigma factor [Maritimibacter sp.]|nr:anti-sigma factor [Maritimibacter sp.]
MIDENKLLALHHGELAPVEAQALERALANDSEAQALLEEWRAQDAALGALLAPVADGPVPSRLAQAVEPHGPGRLLQAAVLAGVLVLGAAGGWTAARLTPGLADAPDLAATAIAAHETYVVEVVHPVEVTADETEHLVGWIAKRLGHKISPPDFATQGFRLMGGRILPGDGATAALFMYENDFGRRISLYVLPTPDGSETAFRLAEKDGMQSFWWIDEGLSCAIVGDVPRETLRAIALDAYHQLI